MASEIVTRGTSKTYLSIIGGRLKQKVDAATEGAEERIYEDKEGNDQSKFELTHKNITGKLVGFDFDKKDFGVTMLEIIIIDDQGVFTQIGTPDNSRYASDFMEKLPNIDLTKDIVFNTYDFEAKNKKTGKVQRKTGVSIIQGKDSAGDPLKINTAYFDFDKMEPLRGLPQVDKEEADDYDTDDWKMYYLTKKKFLVKETKKIFNKHLKTLDAKVEEVKATTKKQVDSEPDDLPF